MSENVAKQGLRQEDAMAVHGAGWLGADGEGNAISARGWNEDVDTAVKALATEPVERPYADLPIYDGNCDRETILRRYAHIAELTLERHPEYEPYWVAEWATMYALDPGLVGGYQSTINMLMIVAALLLGIFMGKQTDASVADDSAAWSHDSSLRRPFLYLNGLSVALFITCILGGTIIFENVTRRPFTSVDTWMILMDHWNMYVIWCQTLTLGVLLTLIAFMLEVVGVNETAPAYFTVVCCALGGVFALHSALTTTAQVGKFQTLRTKQFMHAYVDMETGHLHEKWLTWLRDLHAKRHGIAPDVARPPSGSMSVNASS
eukprot:g5821.t1